MGVRLYCQCGESFSPHDGDMPRIMQDCPSSKISWGLSYLILPYDFCDPEIEELERGHSGWLVKSLMVLEAYLSHTLLIEKIHAWMNIMGYQKS